MKTLESEATYIIKNLRSHPCLAFWCGGNELFNSWSGMDDQSLPLRLLNKLCFEYDPTSPFIATSPLMGMAHGGYRFYEVKQGGEVFHQFQRSRNTAYTEFGVPGMSSLENLKKAIPEDELFPIKPTASWVAHHGLDAWGPHNWVCMDVLEMYFGKQSSLEEVVENSSWLQCEGYKAAFEEMRRQWPHCSMALNWCYNEPWITAANNSIVEYPARPKPAYEAVKAALRPTLFSARIAKFSWREGETFEAELWLLNDKPERAYGKVKAVLQIGDRTLDLLKWTAEADAGLNTQGPTVRLVLPHADTDRMTLILRAENGTESRYTLQYKPTSTLANTVKILNM
jgi:beta-mannosidase